MSINNHNMMFDTLTFANKLKASGMAANLAETFALAQGELLSQLSEEKLATKDDLVMLATKKELAEVNQELGELKQNIHRLETNIQHLENNMQIKFEVLENRMIIKLGGLLVVSMGALATLLTILHLN